MKIVLFCHSLLSDWNNPSAHFLRGLVSELGERGHEVVVFEPRDGWSAANLEAALGALPTPEMARIHASLRIERYDRATLDLDAAVDGAALVLVHEWNPAELVAALGRKRLAESGWQLFFHDTHHRSVTSEAFPALDLSGYDAVLAFGESLRERYLAAGWAGRAFTFHEAADVRVARPADAPSSGIRTSARRDLVWLGNAGGEDRARELTEFLVQPSAQLRLSTKAYGVRYSEPMLERLQRAGIAFGGYLPNHRVSDIYAQHRVTLHVPRAPYLRALPGIPTVRVFEALASGTALVCALFDDCEGLFRRGDFLSATNEASMTRVLRDLVCDPALRDAVACRGLETVLLRHTCAHRVDELLTIWAECRGPGAASSNSASITAKAS